MWASLAQASGHVWVCVGCHQAKPACCLSALYAGRVSICVSHGLRSGELFNFASMLQDVHFKLVTVHPALRTACNMYQFWRNCIQRSLMHGHWLKWWCCWHKLCFRLGKKSWSLTSSELNNHVLLFGLPFGFAQNRQLCGSPPLRLLTK